MTLNSMGYLIRKDTSLHHTNFIHTIHHDDVLCVDDLSSSNAHIL